MCQRGELELEENPGKDYWNSAQKKNAVSLVPWDLSWFHGLSQIFFYGKLWAVVAQVLQLLEHPGQFLRAASPPGWTLQLYKALSALLLLLKDAQRQSHIGGHMLPYPAFLKHHP